MTPDLSRQLAHLATQYEGKEDADFGLCMEYREYVRKHEDEIASLDDIPAKFSAIIH